MSTIRIVVSLFLIFILTDDISVSGQTAFANKAELEKAANDLFVKKEYSQAKPLFSQLLSQDALNADHNYRFGVCIMFTEADPAKPLPYIEGGANSVGVNPEAFYFLGLVYRFNYRFDQSAEAFQKAKTKGYTAAGIDLDREIQISRNGRILYNDALVFNPAMEKQVIKSEFYRPYDFRKLKGKVIPAPPTFKTKFDEKALLESFVYTPTEATSLFYASLGEDGLNGKDIYKVNKLPTGEWSLPQRLPDEINTKFDEDFAFLDEQTQTLYFSSNGHNTMGGSDIFSSRFDENTGKWSVPVNLQHPINSPFDDFLYLIDPDKEVAFFASNRNTPMNMVNVYKTIFENPDKLDMTVVDGLFDDKTDSLYNFVETTITDPDTKEIVGTYRSHLLTGKYVFILPSRMGYAMNVAPRGASGFNFTLDVPKQGQYQTLKQSLVYDRSSTEASVTLNNYFNKEGALDTVTAVQVKPIGQLVEKMPDVSAIASVAKKEQEKQMAIAESSKAKQLEQQRIQEAKVAQVENERLAQIAEKARLDSIATSKELALKKAEEEKALAAQRSQQLQQAKLDSITKADQLALKKAEEEKALAAQRSQQLQQAKLDSITKADQLALKKAEEEKALAAQRSQQLQQAKLDSITKADQLALKKAEEEKALAVQHSQQLQQARKDSITKADQLALEKVEEEKALAAQRSQQLQQARQDSINTADQLALNKVEEEKALAAQRSQQLQQARQDSITKADLLALKKAKEDKVLAEQNSRSAVLARLDSLKQMKLNEQQVRNASVSNVTTLNTDSVTSVLEADKKAEIAAEELRIAQEQAKQEELELKHQELTKKLTAERESMRLDSILNVEADVAIAHSKAEREASQKVERDRLEQDAKLKEEQQKAILAMKESLKQQQDQLARELAEAKQLAEVERAKAFEQQDTVVPVVPIDMNAVAKAQEEARNANSPKQLDAEELELAELERKAELEHQKATQTALDNEIKRSRAQLKLEKEKLEAQNRMDQESKAESIALERVRLDSLAEVESKQLTLENRPKTTEVSKALPDTKTIAASQESTSDNVTKVEANVAKDTSTGMSDAEIFKLTVAKIEAQRKMKEAQVKLQSTQEVEARAKVSADLEVAYRVASEKAMAEAKESGDTAKVRALQMAATSVPSASNVDTTSSDQALKSNADPNSYVLEMVRTEKQIEAERVRNADKNYALRPMPELSQQPDMVVGNKEAIEKDKALEVKIDQDRKVVSDHQAIALAEEKKLQEQMEQDRKALGLHDPQLAEELRAAEREALGKVVQASPQQEKEAGSEKKTLAEGKEVGKSISNESVISDSIVATASTETTDNSIAASNSITSTVKKDSIAVSGSAKLFLESVAKIEAQKKSEELKESLIADSLVLVVDTSKTVALIEVQPVKTPSNKTIAENVSNSGRPVAMRNYSNRNPDFTAIKDDSQRVLIQRMAAEDRGRIAVLKRVNNAEATEGKGGKSVEKLEQLQRTREVLANNPRSIAREDLKQAYDKNELRQRKDVIYRVQVELGENSISDKVQEALDPAYVAQLSKESVKIRVGHFTTMADTRSELSLLRNLGITHATIVPFANGLETTLSVATSMPFID
jgi:hypothetical protein